MNPIDWFLVELKTNAPDREPVGDRWLLFLTTISVGWLALSIVTVVCGVLFL